LRIRRLTELGVPLSRITEAGPEGDVDRDALRQVDAQLAADIERLQKARSDIATILRDDVPADTPPGFESVASRLSETDSSLIHVYTQLYDSEAMTDLRHMVAADDPVSGEIDTLPADADEATRQRIAEKFAPVLARLLADYPWLSDPAGRLSKSEHVTRQTVVEAVTGLYNPAQIDVLGRASVLAQKLLRDDV
jgi:hypothetical protein